MYRPLRAVAVGGGLIALFATTSLTASAATTHPAHQHTKIATRGGQVTAADYAKRAVTAGSRKHAAHGKASALQVQAAKKAGPAVAGLAAAANAATTAVAGPAMDPGGRPDYFGNVPNYANSQMPTGGASVAITDPAGKDATASATVEKGAVVGVTVDNGGSGYSGSPTVTFGGNGTGATAHATVVGGVTGVAITKPGTGYDSGNPPAVVFSAPATGTDVATGVVTFDGNGGIAGVEIDHAGSGYSTAKAATVTFDTSNGAPGSGAAATAGISGTIDSITVDSGGAGYDLEGTGIRKFVDTLPGVGAANANDLGQYISVAHPDKKSFPGSDYYVIGLVEVQKKLHADLPPTTLRLYVQLNKGMDADGSNVQIPDPPQYMGPMINAEAGRATRVTFVNMLPKTGTGCDRTNLPQQNATVNGTPYNDTAGCGNLFLPVDTNVMGAGMGPQGMAAGNYSENRATIHLHGGKTPWISDGTPHQWITPAGESTAYPKGVSVSSVPDMAFTAGPDGYPVASPTTPSATLDPKNDPGPGAETFYYTNQQSARMMFFHDHSYGITRLNVYAGEEAPYIIHDAAEKAFTAAVADVKDGANTIPLVIQDKTFVPETSQLAAEDPTWDAKKWGGQGNLWMPHVYMPNQNPTNDNGANPMGRWDYGPWFWPPYTGLKNPPVANKMYDPACLPSSNACENITNPGFDGLNMDGTDGNVSQTMESFFDTMLVNGTPYPTKTVGQQVYRLQILNGSNDRHLNLGLYYAKSTVDKQKDPTKADGAMWNGPVLNNGDAGEVPMMDATTAAANDPANGCTPTQIGTWPHDGRDGGVPACNAVGPDLVQIGNDGGFLPGPAPISSQPIDYEYNRRNIIVLDVLHHGLMLAPAERADVLVDFSKVPDGAKLVLYNDAPAANPAVDPRNEYYTGDGDQTSSGGAPSTQPGYGPNTRTVMQFVVDAKKGTSTGLDTANMAAALRDAYQADQPAPIVAEKAYSGMKLPADYTWSQKADGTWGPTAVGLPANPVVITKNTYSSIVDTSLTVPSYDGTTGGTVSMQPKAIQELFDPTWGRMVATLGAELPNTSANTQTTVPLGYAEPANEVLDPHSAGSQIGLAGDGTQIWKITHNGVDSHPVHFHLFDVQLINRVGWDGAKYAPELNELGWKDTVLMHPLEDTIVALRPQVPTLPFKIPNSVRPIDPTMPANADIATFDPKTGQAITVKNDVVDYGWEYVWHCHMLSHEEMDFMRPVIVHGAPPTPASVVGSLKGAAVTLTWSQPGNNNPTVTNYTVQRAADARFTTSVLTLPAPITAATATTLTDPAAPVGTTSYYRVRSESVSGYSTWSSPFSVTVPVPPVTKLTATYTPKVGGTAAKISVSWVNGTPAYTSVKVERALVDASSWTTLSSTSKASPYTDTTFVNGSTYYYRVTGVVGTASSTPTLIQVKVGPTGGVSLQQVSLPSVPSETVTTARAGTADTLTAVVRAGSVAGLSYTVQVSRTLDFGVVTTLTPTPAALTARTSVARRTTYYVRVRANGLAGSSGWSAVSRVVTP